jgi:hypothetical protein
VKDASIIAAIIIIIIKVRLALVPIKKDDCIIVVKHFCQYDELIALNLQVSFFGVELLQNVS